MLKMRKKLSFSPIKVIIFLVLFVYSAALVYMIAWGFFTSLKSEHSYMYDTGNPLSLLPTGGFAALEWSNYKVVYESFQIKVVKTAMIYDIWGLLGNSIFYAVVSSLLGAAVPFVVSYITAKYNYSYCKIINTMVIILIALPIIGSTAPTIRVLNDLGIFDTRSSIIILHLNFINTYYLIYYASWKGVPNEYREAAEIDGASEYAIFFKIMCPMMYKMYFTIFLILFVGLWNDYSFSLLYTPSLPVLAYAVQQLSAIGIKMGNIDTRIPPIALAASMMLLLPILILFIAFHDKLMGNLSMGGLKE